MLVLATVLLAGCEDEYEDTLKAGNDYLESVRRDSAGVLELPSGLLYRPYYADNESWPKVTGKPTFVYVNYTALFINGDTLSFDTARPLSIVGTDTTWQYPTFGYDYMVSGLQEAVRKMHIGSKWRVWIPASLAYGGSGSTNVDPNTVLVYDIELLGAE